MKQNLMIISIKSFPIKVAFRFQHFSAFILDHSSWQILFNSFKFLIIDHRNLFSFRFNSGSVSDVTNITELEFFYRFIATNTWLLIYQSSNPSCIMAENFQKAPDQATVPCWPPFFVLADNRTNRVWRKL